ncbi:hypothetical protein DCS_03063 [Drechmeria coniospora]|uniref:Siroheme synthase n=1 Tax=Drechmeria coniospora TaxID=98403 RepID=A0A151GXT9_DRECN|nr:hypothetical protein DCS_03063 [Drechmeria coniospora]KYK61918.1 hypothetical protein DCS_03063 [Drechmeria coniospora]
MAPRRAVAAVGGGDATSTHDEADSDDSVPPVFNTTFSTHRVSPLYVGPGGLTTARLELLAHRLRDTLVGDVVRGIQVAVEASDTPMGQVGTLRSVSIRWFQPSSFVMAGSAEGFLDGDDGGNQLPDVEQKGLSIELRHENASYRAILLPSFSAHSEVRPTPRWAMPQGNEAADAGHFVELPLLLLRMPQALKAVLGGWLATTFDCRVSKLVLGTKTLVGVWESWIKTAGVSSKGPDFVFTLSFHAAPARVAGEDATAETEHGLRTLEVTVAPTDLRRFLRAGDADGPLNGLDRAASASWAGDGRERRRLAGGNVDDGWAWRTLDEAPKHPFTEALARYLDRHLALNLFHPSVRVVQISCGAFVLAQSRLKLVKLGDVTADLVRASWMFLTQLGARVRDDALVKG